MLPGKTVRDTLDFDPIMMRSKRATTAVLDLTIEALARQNINLSAEEMQILSDDYAKNSRDTRPRDTLQMLEVLEVETMEAANIGTPQQSMNVSPGPSSSESSSQFTTEYSSAAIGPQRQNSLEQKPFRPSRQVLIQQGFLSMENQMTGVLHRQHLGSNYMGSVLRGQNLPPHLNCSIFMTFAPLKTTYTDVFAAILVGKVASCFIAENTAKWPTTSVNLTFTQPIDAARLLAQAHSAFGLRIMGKRLNVVYNRNGYREFSGNQSRVLYIRGPVHLNTVDFWNAFFFKNFARHDDIVQFLPCAVPGYSILEWRFARILCQAESAKMAIEGELNDIFEVVYGHDPCEGIRGRLIEEYFPRSTIR